MVKNYDIPEISFYENKNVFTGSEGNNFRYRIARVDDDEGKKLGAYVWYDDICFELAQDIKSNFFELNTDGLECAADWIFEQKK